MPSDGERKKGGAAVGDERAAVGKMPVETSLKGIGNDVALHRENVRVDLSPTITARKSTAPAPAGKIDTCGAIPLPVSATDMRGLCPTAPNVKFVT